MQRGKVVEAGDAKAVFANPQHAYTKMLLTAEPKGTPPQSDTQRPVVLETKNLKVWFPIKRGFFRKTVGHIKAVDGVDAAGAERADAGRGRRIGLRQDHARPCPPAADPLGRARSSTWASTSTATTRR